MRVAETEFSPADFERVSVERDRRSIVRPSLSYWQDAWRRLRGNKRAFVSLVVVGLLGIFTIAGPWIWRVDPARQDVDQISQGPGCRRAP
jgi:hypothetical protein